MQNDDYICDVKSIFNDGEIYINANDLIKAVITHKNKVAADAKIKKRSPMIEVYEMAHDHIIDIIKLIIARGLLL